MNLLCQHFLLLKINLIKVNFAFEKIEKLIKICKNILWPMELWNMARVIWDY